MISFDMCRHSCAKFVIWLQMLFIVLESFALHWQFLLTWIFAARLKKSRCLPVAVVILVMYADNSGIRQNCEELG